MRLVDKKCCGRPLISKGMLGEAREHAAWNVARLAPYATRGVAIVGLEPSCLLTLRDESVDLLRTDEARTVARQSFLLEEFLPASARAGSTCASASTAGAPCCTATVTRRRSWERCPTVAALRWAGYEVAEVDSGCCGMAGSFGFEREHYDISVTLGNRRLGPAVKASRPPRRSSRPASPVGSRSTTWPAGALATPPRCCGNTGQNPFLEAGPAEHKENPMTLTRRAMLQVGGGTFAGYCLAADPVMAQAIKTDTTGIVAGDA